MIEGSARGITRYVRKMLLPLMQVKLIRHLLMSHRWLEVELLAKLLRRHSFLKRFLEFRRLVIEKSIEILVLVEVIRQNEDGRLLTHVQQVIVVVDAAAAAASYWQGKIHHLNGLLTRHGRKGRNAAEFLESWQCQCRGCPCNCRMR